MDSAGGYQSANVKPVSFSAVPLSYHGHVHVLDARGACLDPEPLFVGREWSKQVEMCYMMTPAMSYQAPECFGVD
jgi:hypothetical protein